MEVKTVQQLQAELDTANATIESQKADLDIANTDLETAKKLVEAQEEKIALQDEKILAAEQAIDKRDEKLAEQVDIIIELNKEVDTLSKQKTVANPTVKHEGKTYAIVIHRFNHNGEIVTATDLESNEELIAQLINQGSGVLELID